jgi:hypothetical protein
MICAVNTNNTIVEKFDWKNALIDAVITSGITFFRTLGGSALLPIQIHANTATQTVAALFTVLLLLALKRPS